MIEIGLIEAARARIAAHIRPTNQIDSSVLSKALGVPVTLKLEHAQVTGSFKIRGALNAILQLNDDEKARGVVAVSTGNHGRALAYAAKSVGSKATICMSGLVPHNKIAEIRNLGADVCILGMSQDEAQSEVDRLVSDQGLILLPPFDHKDIIAGQGTLGLEIVEALPDVETVLVPVSGGGLAAGIAVAVKEHRPNAKVIGVSMHRGAAMKQSLDAGQPILVQELRTLADALGGGIGLDNKLTFRMCRDLLDDFILVDEHEIAAAIAHAYRHEKQIIEGAGAVGIAALISGRNTNVKGRTAVILTGCNIDMEQHRRIINDDPAVFAEGV